MAAFHVKKFVAHDKTESWKNKKLRKDLKYFVKYCNSKNKLSKQINWVMQIELSLIHTLIAVQGWNFGCKLKKKTLQF